MPSKRRKRKACYSGIGGQAVIEGIMMKNRDKYSVAVRTPEGDIDVTVEEYESFAPSKALTRIPFIRGVFNFIDSLILGIRTLNYSASFYEEEQDTHKKDKILDRIFKDNAEKVLSAAAVVFSIVIAIGLFVLLPYYLSRLLESVIVSDTAIAILEGVLRVLIFVGYIVLISCMKDIRRVFMYHGAEHKCINCLEAGLPLTVENVRQASREHRRCGTSFLLYVMVISIVFFAFIQTDTRWLKIVMRIVLIPLIAGVSYEFIRLAGKSDNPLVRAFSKPGLMLQKLTTREPDDEMIEVGIRSVDEIFDWRGFLRENFGEKSDDDLQ